MPTANTTSAKPTKARKARRAASAKASTATRTTPRRSTRTKTARTRTAARTRTIPPSPALQSSTRDTGQLVGDYAERAVLIPVGAALMARDRVVSNVSDTISTYSSTTKTRQQLRRFERRGATARNRLEREVRKARVRVERELRQRRRRVERELRQRRRAIETTVGEIDDRRETIAKNGSELASRVQERILSLV
jgi:hypothetical protein